MRRKNEIILWPVYFDALRSRREGRRLPKKLCVRSLNISMLERAVKNLSLKYEVHPEASYPRLPWIKMGFVAVSKDRKNKSQVLREVASELIKLCQQP
ncbi:MAG: signal recognition particle subunit SRP19/SEC65 family protein [Candidatus Bathyarchaeia archaeon]|nr:signal recognition particle protein Srp19 [Candidatus Bathyarchaeota archaeon]